MFICDSSSEKDTDCFYIVFMCIGDCLHCKIVAVGASF